MRRKCSRWRLKKSILLFSWFFLLTGQPQAFAQSDKINIIYTTQGGSNSALWITKEAGFLAKYGIDSKLVYISGSNLAASSLMAGEAPIGLFGSSAPILSRLQGADLTTVANTTSMALFSFMTTKDVQTLADLKGKTLGVVRYGTTGDFAIRTLLRRAGLDPQKDVKILQVGGVGAILAGMQSGMTSGGILNPPITQEAKRLGFRELLDPKQVAIKFSQAGVVVSDRYLKNNRSLIQRFTKAFIEGIHFYKTQKNFSLSVLKKYTRSNDTDILEATYRLFALEYLPRAPYPTEESVRTLLDLIQDIDPKARTANPSDFVNPEFIRELDTSGFIANLYN